MFEVYKPSGGVGLKTWPLLVIGVAIVLVLAFIYALLLDLIPFIYVNALLALGMGIAVGTIAAFIIRVGHCRNVLLATGIGLLLAAAALGGKFTTQYFKTRAAAIAFLEEMNVGEMEGVTEEDRPEIIAGFKQDYTIVEHLKERVDAGWNLGRRGNGAPIGGGLVYLVWAIEAGILFYYGWTMSRGAAKEPYSEKMNMWADESEAVMLLPITSDEMVSKIQSATSVDQLLEIPIPKTDQSAKLAQYVVNSIPGQEMEDAYLTVQTLEYSINKKGEQETIETMLVENAILSSQQRAQLVENAELLNEAIEMFRASEREERAAESSEEESGDTQEDD
jgi:hypothetical protein